MRKAFARILSEIADADQRVILLTADLGYDVLDEFRARHPDKFVNVGVAEQAMVGAATGLAREGFVPYCYSIGTFMAFRPLEFLRNGPVGHELPVRIVGVGRDTEYGHAGSTHWPVNDTLIVQMVGLDVFMPEDVAELAKALPELHQGPLPFYLSLSKNGDE